MAHIGKITRNGRLRWRARYIDPSGRERERWFDRKLDAQQFLASVEAAKLRGDYVDPAAGRRLFGDVATEWRKIQIHDATTVDLVTSQLRNHILPAFGERPIASIRPSQVQAFVAALSQKLSPATVEVIYRHLSSIFKMAVRDGIITKTPCVEIKLPSKERPPVMPPTTEEVEALYAAMPERYQALVVLAAGTGLRQGEAFGLTVPHVEFLRRDIRVVQQLKLVLGRPAFLDDLKTPASYRAVPAADVVLDALARHVEQFPPSATLLGYRSGQPELLLFTAPQGGPLLRNRFGEVWRLAARRAGLPSHMTFHDLRHFYASALIREGLSVKAVQARLGHKTAKETLDTYGHLWPDDDDRSRAAVQSVLGARFELGRGGDGDGGELAPAFLAADVQ